MTFIAGVGNAIPPVVVAFVCAALLALVLTPVVRRVVIRYEMIHEARVIPLGASPRAE